MKRSVWLVSRLKPANDVRMAKKLAISFKETGFDEICITGKGLLSLPHQEGGVTYLPYKCQKPEDGRKWQQIPELFKIALNLKPQVIVVCSPDLLPLAVCHKILFGSKLYYDIQEDYQANLAYMKTTSSLMGYLKGGLVRMVERICAPFIDEFLLAERKYVQKLGFIGNRYRILENKALPIDTKSATVVTLTKTISHLPVVYFGGTLSEEFGIVDLVEWYKNERPTLPYGQLRLLGHCPNGSVKMALDRAKSTEVSISGSWTAYPASYDEIKAAGSESEIWALPYRMNKAIAGKVPTKLYQSLYEKKVNLHHSIAFSNIEKAFAKHIAKSIWDFKVMLK